MSTPIYLKLWREKKENKKKLQEIRARYYYSKRNFILEEYGYRLMADDSRSRGEYDPEILRNKSIQMDTTLLGPFRGAKGYTPDFNVSPFIESVKDNPINISFSPNLMANPNLPVKDFNESETFFKDILGAIGMSSSISCAIFLNVIYSN